MFHVVLFEPEIPPNTGNIIRLCANSGMQLHLIHPLGFSPTDKHLRRAGLDYHEWTRVFHHQNYAAFLAAVHPPRIFACSTRGSTTYSAVSYAAGDAFLFGPETRGLPSIMLEKFSEESIIRIPMLPSSRSLNLSNAVAVVVYEAWRQMDFSNTII